MIKVDLHKKNLSKQAIASFRKSISAFFYHFSQSIIATKIKSHGRLIASGYDLCAVIIAWLCACWIFSDSIIITTTTLVAKASGNSSLMAQYWKMIFWNLFCILPPQLILFRIFGLYRGFWRFASIQDLRKIVYVSILGSVLACITTRTPVILLFSFPYTAILLYCVFLITFLSSGRFLVRFAKDYKRLYSDFQRVIIIGAGNAGESLVRDLLRDRTHYYKPVAFVDDDLRKQGREIHGIRVMGTTVGLPKFIEKYKIDLILIAIPSASSSNMRSVVEICEKAKIPCFTLPGIKDLANGHVNINVLRKISLEDLLGRYPVSCQWDAIRNYLQHKTILVTGGGGSIGSELCRQIALLGGISQLVIVDSNEYNLYSIEIELRKKFPDCAIALVLLNITDRIGVQFLLQKYCPQVVFHAAAYKHVPMLEYQIRAGIYNNVIGTFILAEESAKMGIEKFILISSDKAVNPTNIMGATKRSAEYFCQNLNYETSKTQFITVRFGNVLESAGSVVPLFRNQIESGGPVTVTHPEITRFFMTIPEASQLILQATFLGEGGEIFVLDMGDPIQIRYLAEQMIRLAGKVIDQDIKIIYTGLRPGEKLYEECFYSDETLQSTTHSKILRAQSQRRDFNEIKQIFHKLLLACQADYTTENELMELLEKLVPEYKKSSRSVNQIATQKVLEKLIP